MNNFLVRMFLCLGLVMLVAVSTGRPVYAADDQNVIKWDENKKIDGGGTNAQEITQKINKLAKPFAGILIFASVIAVGFEIIIKRNKADERMESMSSLMWIGIGCLILASAVLFTNMIFK